MTTGINNKPARARLIKALIAAIIVVLSVVFLFWYTGQRKGAEDKAKQAVFGGEIVPILDGNKTANEQALKNLENDIHSLFEKYRSRVPMFTEDITGFGNKIKIVWKTLWELPSEDKEKVERHVAEKFALHVVDEKTMKKEIGGLLTTFRYDIEANQNEMLADIDAVVSAEPLFESTPVIPEQFSIAYQRELAMLVDGVGTDTMVISGVGLIASVAAEEAVRNLVTLVIARIATSIGASVGTGAALAGGSAVAGGTVGGGGGSVAGPVGIVAGATAGIVVGFIVDKVIGDRLKKKLNGHCSKALTKAENELLKKSDGLIRGLATALEKGNVATSGVIKEQLHILQ